MRIVLIAGLLLCGGAIIDTPADAADGSRSHAIRTADLDLSRPADVVEARRRMRRALDDVCGSFAGANPDTITAITRCRAQASANARRAMSALIARAGEVRTAAR